MNTTTLRPRPQDNPASIALTEFRDALPPRTGAGALSLSSDPLFSEAKLSHPAQKRILNAIEKDISEFYEGSTARLAWSFSPQKVLRGVKSKAGALSRKDLFYVIAAEVAQSPTAQITLQQRWCAMAASIAHGGIVTALRHCPKKSPIHDADLTSLTTLLKEVIREESFDERMFLTAVTMQGKTALVEKYLQGREDGNDMYRNIATGLAEAVTVMPVIKTMPKFKEDLLPALEFIHSKIQDKEFVISNPLMDLVSALSDESSVTAPDQRVNSQPNGISVRQMVTLRMSEEEIERYTKNSDFLFKTIAPNDMDLSESFLVRLDNMFTHFPEMRLHMPAISSVWSKSRLEGVARASLGNAPTPRRRPGM